jgi:uncharacterized protein
MLIIKTKLGPSKIHGVGVFADEFIPKGVTVWVFFPGLDLEIDKEQLSEYPRIAQDYIKKYAYLSRKSGKYVMCFDNCRFTNHSYDPNTAEVENYPGEAPDYALRDIQKGEEITINYQIIDGDFEKEKVNLR